MLCHFIRLHCSLAHLSRATIGLIVLGLAACAPTTQAQLDRDAFEEATVRGNQAGEACVAKMKADPRYAGLLRRYPLLDVLTVPLPVLMSEAYATPQESQTLLALHADRGLCKEARYAAWQATRPQIVALFRAADGEQGEIYAALIQRRVTWGDGFKRLRQNATDVLARVRANEAEMTQAMDQRHQAENERRRQNIDAMSGIMTRHQQQQNQMFQNQQILNTINRPRSTNCTNFGNTVNCTSY